MSTALASASSPRDIASARRTEHLRTTLGALVGGLLADPTVTDIYLNPTSRLGEPGEIWVVRLGEAPRVVGTMSADRAAGLVEAVAGTLSEVVTRARPWVEGELYGDGPRFTGLIPPAVMSPAWAIRRPSSRGMTLADYEAQGTLTRAQHRALLAAIQRRDNIVVVGATGTGKTTLLNAIAAAVAEIHPQIRLLTIEGAREMQIRCRNVVALRTMTDAFDERQALRSSLRLIPDAIWVGEVRGPEVMDMLMAWNTGHRPGVCSLHSDTATPEDALVRIEQMASLASATEQQRTIGRTIDLIVCLQRDDDGRRHVSRMVAVRGYDKQRERYVLADPSTELSGGGARPRRRVLVRRPQHQRKMEKKSHGK